MVTQIWLMCVEPFLEFVLLWTVSVFPFLISVDLFFQVELQFTIS